MGSKKPWMSKTIWMGIISAALPFVPAINAWVIAYPEAWASIVGAVFVGLRTITDGKISLH